MSFYKIINYLFYKKTYFIKVIFETLESAVGSVTGKARPQSLRETIERPTATLPRREARKQHSPVTDRMQILAGIKKSK